jgi:hypothetical protein
MAPRDGGSVKRRQVGQNRVGVCTLLRDCAGVMVATVSARHTLVLASVRNHVLMATWQHKEKPPLPI